MHLYLFQSAHLMPYFSLGTVGKNLLINLLFSEEAECSGSLSKFNISFTAVEFNIHFEFGETDRTQRPTRHSFKLKWPISSIQSAFVINAMLQAKHMTDFVHHSIASELHRKQLNLFICPSFLGGILSVPGP